MDINNMADKEFKVMVIKVLSALEKRMYELRMSAKR